LSPDPELASVSESFLKIHLARLFKFDIKFAEFWGSLNSEQRDALTVLWKELHEASDLGTASSEVLYLASFDRTRRLFLGIQEKGSSYINLPPNWTDFVKDKVAKLEYYNAAYEFLSRFVRQQGLEARLYGGIKSDESIRNKQKRSAGGVFFDLWDVIRFRVVLCDLPALMSFSNAVWQTHFESIAKCRNFYFRPRNGPHDPYRAIHFELLFNDIPLELQVMSRHREAVCHLDHQFILKRNIEFLDHHHERWLRAVSRTANILEVNDLK